MQVESLVKTYKEVSVILVIIAAIFPLLLKTARDGGENTPRNFFNRSCMHWPAAHWMIYNLISFRTIS